MKRETQGLPLDVIFEVIAKGDERVLTKDPVTGKPCFDPHRVKFGKGQRSGLFVLLRALEGAKR